MKHNLLNTSIAALIFLFNSALSSASLFELKDSYVDQLAIEIKNKSREFFYTNKISGFYYGETNSPAKNGWQGWTVSEKKIFTDYSILIDTVELNRSSGITNVFPYKLRRDYSNDIIETFLLADSLNLIFIKLSNLEGNDLTLYLHKIMSFMDCSIQNNIAILKAIDFTIFVHSNTGIKNIIKHDSDCSIVFQSSNELVITLSLDSSVSATIKLFNELLHNKRERIGKLLTNSFVKSNYERFDRALAWNKAALDALITHQGMKGIYAGLPWFNNYWGRDTFISLPGASFTQGNFSEAKEILLAFAREQEINPTNKFYGRIPNRITLNEKIYNTTDGTPWFVIQAYKYLKASGDTNFAKMIYPTIKTAIDGALKYYIDKNYFLTHEDAETWMDAVGPNGAWSPRGNRANDIQALWYRQLKFSAELAKLNNDDENYRKWLLIAQKLKSNIKEFFIEENNLQIYDHLNSDNTPDRQIRPNQFFILNESDFFDSPEVKFKLLASAISKLVFPYGVLSLSQEDKNFHPYHHYEPYYVQDAAYHNGIIWLWNFGPVISSLQSFRLSNFAFTLTEELVRQTLEAGCIGSLSELTDAFPRDGEKYPRLSGTFTQAWSMAEFIRNFYYDYLGLEQNALEKSLYLLPSLPEKINEIKFRTRVGEDYLIIFYSNNAQEFFIEIDGREIKDSIDIGINVLNRINVNFVTKFSLLKNETARVKISHFSDDKSGLSFSIDNTPKKVNVETYKEPSINSTLYKDINFAEPKFNKDWESIKQVDYEILPLAEIKQFSESRKLVLSSEHSVKKDYGYSYPLNPNFKPGILNLEKFELQQDERNYFFNLKFENLHDPGWHPEYGFQLTFAAIAIQTSLLKRGSTDVGLNSNLQLSSDRKFNYLIVVGGGVEIRNSDGKILAAYIPQEADVKNPLGNVSNKEISFALPKKFIGEINIKSKITILIGAQDDHGGAGIGEFRMVQEHPSEWLGGGKKNPHSPNIYQIIKIN
jgi:glycogen debranching enzyme